MHTLSKPAGRPVFPPHADPEGDCLLARWVTARPSVMEVPWPEGFAGGIAHRLDIGTSGAVAVAEDLEELAALREAFRGKRLRKTYRFVSRRDVALLSLRRQRFFVHTSRRLLLVLRA